MAIMYPEKPHECEAYSCEEIMFDCLEKLPDTYYVFHSFKIVNVIDDTIRESETDFVIVHPEKGILCLEAKAGKIKYDNGWRYSNGTLMKHNGPYRQAALSKWKLRDLIQFSDYSYLLERCKLLHGVWFPTVSRSYFNRINLPAESDMHLTLTRDSFDNLEAELSQMMDIRVPQGTQTKLSDRDMKILMEKFLAPKFDLISLADMRMDNQRHVFKRLLNEQVALLNYLEEQKSAVINGLAGTGKTVMAIEKARRHADQGEPVLFLCYNVFLKEYLQRSYPHEHISYYTIDGLACKLCDTPVPNYDLLKNALEEMYLEESFPYRHIIIDEGQDFGRERLNDISIIELLRSNVADESKDGTFYLFYDRNQMVHTDVLPSYIAEADCRLTLYRNCRNTENIARTSLRLLGSEKKPKLFEGALIGDSPEMYFAADTEKTVNTVNRIIEDLWAAGYEGIQILTCKTEQGSIIADECSTGIYTYKKKKIPFTTCRKYKGLESDAIILLDLDLNTFQENAEQIMYVGSSRARFKLYLIANLSEADCLTLLNDGSGKKIKKPEKSFAVRYNAKFRTIKEESVAGAAT
ncbi:MAG: ATP-binding domain-containing protein [Oscillospiraceae bacterium]|nr:ATP-binding domain-containing protein [Oscillospiraceae bacterium]